MRKSRKVFIAVALVLVLVAPFQLAIAASATQYRVHITNATIPWIISLGSFCPEIPEGVVISPDPFGSDRVKHATQTTRADGSQRVVITDLVTGTASDNSGTSYTFVYQNDINVDYDGSTAVVSMKDTFKIKGGSVNYTAGFNWRWAYETDNLDVFTVVDSNGNTVDIGIDPFFFATDDGVSEGPNIVPGSWQQISTRGDPLSCDPL